MRGWRHVLWVATLGQWDHFHGDLSLLFLCRFLQKFACLFLLRRRKDRSIHPNKRVPLSLLYHPIKMTSNKFYQRALNIITFWWFLQAWKQFQCLNIVLGRFPFVRTDRPDHSTISQIPNSRHKGNGLSTKALAKKHFSLSKWLVPAMVWPANSDFWKAPLIKSLITYNEPSTRHREQTTNGWGLWRIKEISGSNKNG